LDFRHLIGTEEFPDWTHEELQALSYRDLVSPKGLRYSILEKIRNGECPVIPDDPKEPYDPLKPMTHVQRKFRSPFRPG
jgi:hypothetical protein